MLSFACANYTSSKGVLIEDSIIPVYFSRIPKSD